jgi:hypothetical protein
MALLIKKAKQKNHSAHCPAVVFPCKPREKNFKAKVALEAIYKEMTMADLVKKIAWSGLTA